MARHMEQPGSRQSAPAAVKMVCKPSASACNFTRCEPGTTMTRGAVTLRPFNTAAAARRSSMRELVHEPINTVSTLMSRMAVPAARPMYSSARAMVSFCVASSVSSGDGSFASIPSTWPGLVPQVTCGVSFEASMTTSLSHFAPSSETSVRQSATAASQLSPFGA